MTPLQLVRGIAGITPPPPAQHLLAGPRREALEATLGRLASEREALRDGVLSGEEEAREALGQLATRALSEMRQEVGERTRGHMLQRGLDAMDRVWRDTAAVELMDRPDLPEARRARILAALDRFNDAIGSYAHFLAALRPLLRREAPTHVLDLASGHGGFPIALAELAREQGLDLRVTGTDIEPAYLEVGRRRAEERRLEVTFRQLDALDMRPLEDDPPDVILCTQALHHFTPAMVTRVFAEAARVARHGVVFIDGCRCAIHVPVLVAGGGLMGSPDFVHDGCISLRRFFSLEELELLARVAPTEGRIEACFTPPAHAVVRLTRGR